MLAVKGLIQGDKVILENEDIKRFEGRKVILTILDEPVRRDGEKALDFDQFVMPSERGEIADQYIKGLRGDDRL